MSASVQIRKTLETSWRLTKASKLAIWIPSIIAIMISLIVTQLIHTIFKVPDGDTLPTWIQFFLQPIIANFLSAPFFAGAIMVGIKCLRGEKIEPFTGLKYIRPFLPVAISFAVMSLIMRIPTLLSLHHSNWVVFIADVLTAIIFIFLVFAIPLITDKQRMPVQAFIESIKLAGKQWHKIFIVFFCLYLIGVIITIPLGLGIHFNNNILNIIGIIIMVLCLVWLLPWVFLCMSTIYERLTTLNDTANK